MSHRVNVMAMMICVCAGSCSAHAWEFRCRFIERVGNMNVELPGNAIDASSGEARNIRIQFGVFDDADGAAPVGGFLGWDIGSIAVSGEADNSDERRNNGRMSPFTFAVGPNSNGNPPLPGGDPFTMLTEIDATLGTQSPLWICDANGNAPPVPPATVRGRNTFVSVYAFSIDPAPGAASYDITLGGHLLAVEEWQSYGEVRPPVCPTSGNPDGVAGVVFYAPFPTPTRTFSGRLNVVVPSPTGAVLFLSAGGIALLRRRQRV